MAISITVESATDPWVTRITAASRYRAAAARASVMAPCTAATAPRGQSSSETSRPTRAPTTTSSIRTSPTCQPVGRIRLNTVITIIVNIAWLAVKEPTAEM